MKRLLVVVAMMLFLLLLPLILWFWSEPTELQVAIIDKTVPDESYREHLGLAWVLNHFRYTKNDGKPYERSADYYGFVPDVQNQSYRIAPLPASYDDADVIYIADTYGVYEQDFPWVEVEREGERSPLVYGGLELDEWQSIVNRLQQNKRSTLVMEFNSFASPTAENVRQTVSDYLHLSWTGWTGRFFKELDPDLNPEIPAWMLRYHQEVLGTAWEYKGPGFVLVHDVTEELVILEENKHLGSKGIRLSFTESGKEKFGLEQSPDYQYWFDIVTARDEADVLAYYDWDLTEFGAEQLRSKGIPLQFAGIIQHDRNQSRSYYFAGDFADVATVPGIYQYKGLSKIKTMISRSTRSEDSFFWTTYVPLMQTILAESKQNLEDNERKISVAKEGAVVYTSRINGDSFEVLADEGWKKVKIKGVNLGMGKPGTFPGEAAITEDEYYRWIKDIGEMGANAIRVYTLHPPGFYNALKRYNDEHEAPIYLFQGVWIDEGPLEESLDAFRPESTNEFQEEMKRIVDVIHGNAWIEHRPGHASGVYQADVSPYVIGWIIGIEWYPYMVQETNEKYASLGDYEGTYVQTSGALAFEHWLAVQLDELVSYEVEQYQWIRPVSFTNWVTTDLLDHPAEPNEQEDMVAVNPNVIHMKGILKATEQFASYHVYPYYPDFLNYEESYLAYVDHRGEPNNYAAYLKDLHEAHELPILIAEFGVPASRGLTHENPFGWNQGFLTEKEQGEIIVRLYEDIVHEGLLGGLIFTWQDEWFKRTWNTMDYDNPDRRPYWSNVQTNEQQFGLLSFDRHKIKVDGETDDWQGAVPLYTDEQRYLKKLYLDHDERYLYFRLDVGELDEQDPFAEGFPVLLLDTLPNQGNHKIDRIENVNVDRGIDFMIQIQGTDQSRVLVDSYYDFFTFQYGHQLGMLKPEPPLPSKSSGLFNLIQFALNREQYIENLDKRLPFSSYETGKLRHGNGNPDSPDYDSLADFYVNGQNGIIEIRIPWLLLSFSDPSQREVMSDLYAAGTSLRETIEGIYVGVLYVQPQDNMDHNKNDEYGYKVIDSLPVLEDGRMKADRMKMYSWETWDVPLYEERLKQSYDVVKKAFTSDK